MNLFNDVFAFYVNGQNCATVANGSPVSIDTINSNVNPNLYRDNSFLNPPANPINIESDGLSVELICSAPVNAGQVNHMKLAIADTSDGVLDSTVMIKAQSLSTTKPESCNDSVDNNDDTLIDMNDPLCAASTTPPPIGNGGIGSGGNAPPFTGNEGAPIPLDASVEGWTATPDTVSTHWTVTGINGTPGTCDVSPAGEQPVGQSLAIPVAYATCPNEGEYVAHVWGTDIDGHSSFDSDVDFFVHNAPPVVSITAPIQNLQVDVGIPVDVSAAVTDPGLTDTVTCSVDWGDGTSDAGTVAAGLCTASHAYSSAGAQVLAVMATDNGGASAAGNIVVNVNGAATPPTVISNPNSATVVGGQPYSFGATAEATPAATVQWQQSTDGGTTWSDLVGATATPLTGTATLAMNGTQYRAVFTNAGGTATTSGAILTVVQTAVTANASTSSAVWGQQVKISGVVQDASTPSGSIKGSIWFYDGATLLAKKAVVLGTATATYPTTKLAIGTHIFTAVYHKTAISAPVNSNAVTVQVGKATTVVTLSATPLKGKVTTLVAVKAITKVALHGKGVVYPSTVTFYDGATLLGTVNLTTSATATLKTTFAVGSHTLTAVYGGSTTLGSSAPSNVVTVTIA